MALITGSYSILVIPNQHCGQIKLFCTRGGTALSYSLRLGVLTMGITNIKQIESAHTCSRG